MITSSHDMRHGSHHHLRLLLHMVRLALWSCAEPPNGLAGLLARGFCLPLETPNVDLLARGSSRGSPPREAKGFVKGRVLRGCKWAVTWARQQVDRGTPGATTPITMLPLMRPVVSHVAVALPGCRF
jgi:hypothetical protein